MLTTYTTARKKCIEGGESTLKCPIKVFVKNCRVILTEYLVKILLDE